jgi:hypothetical protein
MKKEPRENPRLSTLLGNYNYIAKESTLQYTFSTLLVHLSTKKIKSPRTNARAAGKSPNSP